ncbi:MAG: DNA repair protein RecN [Deltaproteobacteria bacterium]|nr:DNA repair protein RecN [Deltaproteobacteria bacterium]
MLQELSIRNFAIIDDLKIQFASGLTVLSGETGAGKSILINAINLVLGSRASAALIRTGCDAAELEALFRVSPRSAAARTMAVNGYASGEGLLIRRIISRTDSNRIYINGRLATIQQLGAIAENLASISGQHAHQSLLKEEQHLLILDQFGGLMPLRQTVCDAYNEMLPLIENLNRFKALKDRQAQHTELLRYQRTEIDSAALTEAEDARLEQERNRLKNRELLFQIVHQALEEVYSGQGSAAEKLTGVRKNLEKTGRVDSALLPGIDQLAQINFLIEELVDLFRAYLKTVETDESRLEAVEERLDLISKLKRKYGGSLKAVLAHSDAIARELSEVENIDEQIPATEKQLADCHGRMAGLVLNLSKRRCRTAKALSLKVEAELKSLKMAQTRFEVALHRVPSGDRTSAFLQVDGMQVFESGFDRAVFRIAPNVGEEFKPLTAIASGGELSRIVLALKSILAATDAVETVIFDEVDAGIGGGTAEVVGHKLLELSSHHQVICITHLPQIAKFGAQHFSISKRVVKGRTLTAITVLDESGRIEELARMLGGVDITATTRNHARELLKQR